MELNNMQIKMLIIMNHSLNIHVDRIGKEQFRLDLARLYCRE